MSTPLFPHFLPRTVAVALAAFVTAPFVAAPAAAQAPTKTYPAQPIEWVVPYPAGGGTDVVARTLGQEIGQALGQSVVIQNKPGAATNIGADHVARARADGYTILSADTATLAANPFLYRKLSYNAARDFASVGLTVRFPLILAVHPSVPAKNWAELKQWLQSQASDQTHSSAQAKTYAKGEPPTYASPGAGSPHHLAMELLANQTQLKLLHVPYRGAAPAVQDVAAGQVPFMFIDTAVGQGFIASGRLRAIGVASAERVRGFEDVPTLHEQGLTGFEAFAWQGVVAPRGTPEAVIAQLNAALKAALSKPAVRDKLQGMGLEILASTPEQMSRYAEAERTKWGRVIQEAGIHLD